MPDYANAIWMPNNNFFPNRNEQVPKYIILHGTAGGTSAEAIGAYFKSTESGNNPVSSHYIVGTDGHVVQTVSENDGAWANGVLTAGHDSWWDPQINPNDTTISIEHCKPSSDNSDTLTPLQQDASFKLIRDICQRWNIPMRLADASGGITGHFSIDPVNRSRCPGTYPWDELWSFLQNGENNMSGVPSGWSDDGHALKGPDGTTVVLGFRDHVLASDWNSDDVPLSAEYHADSVLIHAEFGPGQRQLFRRSFLWWTQGKGVIDEQFKGWELDAAYNALSAANAKIADLEKQIASLQSASANPNVRQAVNQAIAILQPLA